MFAAGATSFISKKSNGSELRSAITKVLKRQKYVPVWMLSAKQPLEDMLTRLPPKLFQLSKMIAAGLSNKEIAVAQDTTENAVKAQIKRLYQHTDTLTRSEFIVKYAKALRHLEQIQSLD
jgi:DNA-binding NarL/FixJ family response regulator